MDMLIQGGRVWNGEEAVQADVLVQSGVITAVGPGLAGAGAAVVDARGCLLAPGFTDLHVHLRQPGFEAKETVATGTAAAAAGGFTTVCSMPNLAPVPDCLQHLQPQLDAIEKDALVRVLPYGAATVGEKGECMADIPVLAAFVAGFSDDGRGVQGGGMMRRVMQAAARQNSMVAAHCEVDALLPQGGVCVQENSAFAGGHGHTGHSNESEWAEIDRDIQLAKETGCRLHICHISTAQGVALVRAAKAGGLAVTCEVTPHNLLLSCDDITEDDGRFKMNPPLRTREDVAACVAGLADGTIDAVATDHAPHTAGEKAGGFAAAMNGVVGLETAFPVLYTRLVLPGLLPLKTLLAGLTGGPRRVLGEGQPPIAAGQKADVTLLDLNTRRIVEPENFKTKGRATPFAGWELQGWPLLTLCAGRQVYRRA